MPKSTKQNSSTNNTNKKKSKRDQILKMNSTNDQANGRYTSHTWEILYLIFSTQTLNDPSDLNILQRKLVEESERMQEYFPGYRAFHLDFALWKSFRKKLAAISLTSTANV